MKRLDPVPGLPPVGTAVSLALGVLKHAKVRRWSDLPHFPEDLALTTGQPELLTRFAPAITHVAAAADGRPLVTVVVCTACRRWLLFARGTAPKSCPMSLDCPGEMIKVAPAQLVPLVPRSSGRIERPDGTVEFRLDDVLHNPDGPAATLPDGETQFWVKGKLHNADGPAISRPDGTFEHWVRGRRHNPDGPAAKYPDGTVEFWVNGKLRSKDGPGRIRPDGTREFFDTQGRWHRAGAPAVERPDGTGEWFAHGRQKSAPLKGTS